MTLRLEQLRQIRRIELRTRRLVDDAFAGAYHAVFKGRGVEFNSVRPYIPGDDVRSIDWNVTARVGEPFIKEFIEERELTVMLLLDTSASSFFGTAERSKHDLAAELGAVLAYSAIRNNDKVGLILFSDQIESYVPPRKNRNHILRLIRDILAVRPSHRGTDLALAIRTANHVLKRRAIVFLMSDFLASSDSYQTELALTARRHDTVAIVLSDPLEQAWPRVGLVRVRDLESGMVQLVDTAHQGWAARFEQQARRFQHMRDLALMRAKVDRIDVITNGDYLPSLAAFFERRRLRSR